RRHLRRAPPEPVRGDGYLVERTAANEPLRMRLVGRMARARPHAVEPRTPVLPARRGERRSGELLRVEPERRPLRRGLALRQRAGHGLRRKLVSEAGEVVHGTYLLRRSRGCRLASGCDLDDAAADLIELDRLEERLEVAVAEALVALALDDLEEDRAEEVLGEDLEKETFRDAAVDEDLVRLHAGDVLTVAGDALVDELVVRVDRVLEDHATLTELLDRSEDVFRRQREVLDALAVVLADELFDLALVVLALVERDADRAVRRNHRLREEAGRLALDVEVLL